MSQSRNRYFSAVSNTNHVQPVYNYVWDDDALITGGGQNITGAWRPATSQDMGGTAGTSDAPISLPAGSTGSSPVVFTGLALAANADRSYWTIQNMSPSGSLYVSLGQTVTSSSYNIILNPAQSPSSAGASYEDSIGRWKGEVYVSGQGTYIAWEL